MNVQPFLEDPTFPQLGIAGDPELMQEIFQEYLQPLEKAYHIRDCRLSRVRYRQGARCVLQYTLRLAELETGHEQIQWVTGVMYAEDQTRRKWEKLRLLDPGGIPDVFSTFEPFSFIPEVGMLVEVFPYDRRLPTLPLLIAGPTPELESPLLARFGPGDWHTEAWNVEPVRYRAEKGATLRFTIRARDDVTGRTEERRFYAKVYRGPEDGEQTYQVLRTLWSKTATGGMGFTVGKPIAYLSDLRTLLQEESSGTSLQEILLQDDKATPAARRAAKALAALHLDCVPTPRRHRLHSEVTALERTGRLLCWACPHLRVEIEETVRAVIADLKEVPPAPTHLDLKLDHILLSGDRLALIDLDNFAEADPVLDVASVLARLGGMPFRFPLPHDRLRAVSQDFADEYFAHVPETWRGRLPVHYAGAVLKVAAGFFRRQDPEWPQKIATLLERARASLTGGIWVYVVLLLNPEDLFSYLFL